MGFARREKRAGRRGAGRGGVPLEGVSGAVDAGHSLSWLGGCPCCFCPRPCLDPLTIKPCTPYAYTPRIALVFVRKVVSYFATKKVDDRLYLVCLSVLSVCVCVSLAIDSSETVEVIIVNS